MSKLEKTFLEHYRTSGYRKFERQERELDNLGVRAILSQQQAHTLSDPATDELVLGLTLSGSTAAHWSVDGRWRSIKAREVGALGVSPLDKKLEFDIEKDHSLLILTIPNKLLRLNLAATNHNYIDILNSAVAQYWFSSEVETTIRNVWRELATIDSQTELVIEGYINVLLGQLMRLIQGHDSKTAAPSKPSLELNRIDEYLRSRMGEKITLDQIASVCDMPTSTFRRRFKQQNGVSPYAYVRELRLKMAYEYLHDPKVSIAQIAQQLGFSDQSHLSREFRRRFKFTPTDLLRQLHDQRDK